MVAARNITKKPEPPAVSEEMAELQKLYELINPEEIEAFLQRKPHLFKLLRDARQKLEEYLPGSQTTLELDAESNDEQVHLWIMVHPPEEMTEINSRVGKFDKDWYMKSLSEIKGDIHIGYEHHSLGTAWDVFKKLVGKVEAPEDWSLEHDHYRLGTPKRYS